MVHISEEQSSHSSSGSLSVIQYVEFIYKLKNTDNMYTQKTIKTRLCRLKANIFPDGPSLTGTIRYLS